MDHSAGIGIFLAFDDQGKTACLPRAFLWFPLPFPVRSFLIAEPPLAENRTICRPADHSEWPCIPMQRNTAGRCADSGTHLSPVSALPALSVTRGVEHQVNGTLLDGMPLDLASSIITGPPNSRVDLQLQRPGMDGEEVYVSLFRTVAAAIPPGRFASPQEHGDTAPRQFSTSPRPAMGQAFAQYTPPKRDQVFGKKTCHCFH